MAVHHQIDVITHCVSHRCHTGFSGFDRLESFNGHCRGYGHGLHGCESFSNCLPSQICKTMSFIDRRFVEGLHVAAAQVTIEPNRITHRATPEFMAGHVGNFADNVPQSQINPRDGSTSHDPAAMPEMLTPHHLPEILDSSGIFTNEQLREIFNCSHNTPRMPFQRGLAPANEPRLVCHHFDKNPVPHPRMTNSVSIAVIFKAVLSVVSVFHISRSST